MTACRPYPENWYIAATLAALALLASGICGLAVALGAYLLTIAQAAAVLSVGLAAARAITRVSEALARQMTHPRAPRAIIVLLRA